MPDSKPADELRRASLATLKTLAAPAANGTGGDGTGEGGRWAGGEPPGTAALLATSPLDPDSAALQLWRGRIDALALATRFSDSVLHSRLAPPPGAREILFTQLEQSRVQAFGGAHLPGMRANLAALHAQLRIPAGMRVLEAARLRFGAPMLAGAGPADWRSGIDSQAARHIEDMAQHLHDQAAFALHAAALIEHLDLTPENATRFEPPEAPQPLAGPATAAAQANPAAGADASQVGILRRISSEPRGIAIARESAPAAGTPAYHAYSKEFDLVWEVREARAPVDGGFDAEIAARLQAIRSGFARWAHRLQRHLLVRQMRAWQFDREEGVLDAARLTRVVIEPLQPLLFKQESPEDFPLTAVTILLDCSGSMRGLPIATAAGCTELLAAVLERSGVRVEILGFTTRHWRGGQTREKWLADLRPEHPGRLTDLLHIVYKRSDVSWRRARRNLAAMLDERLLKENVDGEALLWAQERLLRRPEPRRILMVISDGAPLDDATLAANDAGYLDRHLRAVIRDIERRGAVELLAIGIGHNVGAYYSRSFTVSGPENLGEAIVTQLVALLDGRGSRHGRKTPAGTT
jgi:cobaltochelatase CobT